ncbi:helix-turn-helix domain-containing protein [Myxococcaceae bacterium GXIMD 01537]
MPATTPPDSRASFLCAPAPLEARVEFVLWQPELGAALEHEVTPDANADLLVELSATHCRVVLHGPVTRLLRVQTRADCAYAVVHFHPGASPRLVDASPAELVDGAVELRHVAGLSVDALGEALLAAGSPRERAGLLLRTLQAAPWPEQDTFDRALRHLVTQEPMPRVARLAEALHLSPRTLERAFRERVGLSPRTFQRIRRLESAVAALRADGAVSLSELAFASGYSDHAHLTREFRALTGRTPSELRARL